jgi:hypothetical protein
MKTIIVGLLIFASTLLAAAQTEKQAPIQIMILGTYHMGNPGLDLHNVKAGMLRLL